MSENNFFQKLNNAQLKAANHNKGPMLVLAGPGSGKTAVITARIKNLIEKYNVPPRNILAVTFSKAAAKEMQERFSKQLAAKTGVTFSTLHSLCFGILRKAGGYEHANILTEASKKHMIFEILNDMNSSECIYNPEKNRFGSSAPKTACGQFNLKSSDSKAKSGSLSFASSNCKAKSERHSFASSDCKAKSERHSFASSYCKNNTEGIYFSSPDFGNEISDTAKKLSDEISRFKSGNLAADFSPSEIIRPFFVPVFRAYENKKRGRCAIDFDDMLIYAFEILKHSPLLLNDLRKKYVYILVDEFQDTNPLQYEILKLLASSKDQNFFAVGDDDQSIYGFRGAIPSVMKNFLNDFKNAETVLLDINYRCHPEIIKISGQLISFNKNRFEKKIIPAAASLPPDISKKPQELIPFSKNKLYLYFNSFSDNKKNKQLSTTGNNKNSSVSANNNEYQTSAKVVVFKNFECINDECRFICDELLNAVRLGKDLSDIAVLYRNSYEAVTLTANLKMRNIPYTAKEKIPNPFEHFIAMDIVAYIRTAVNLISEKSNNSARSDLLRIINKPLRYISRVSLSDNTFSNGNLTSNTYSRLNLQFSPVHESPAYQLGPYTRLFVSMYRFYSDKPYMYKRVAKLESDLRFITGCPPLAAIRYIRHAVGYEKYLKDYASEKKLDFAEFETILSLLESTASDFKTNRLWLDFINDCCLKNSAVTAHSANESAPIKKSVQIMTMHASKGLEFDTVFIPQLNAGFIPHAKALSIQEIEEERRLLYVAATRAKNRLIISCDKNINEKPAIASPFFEEMLPI